MTERIRSIYGNPAGSYLTLDTPVGVIPPPEIGGHIRLGSASDMATALNYHMKQADLAALIGVSQQEISRWGEGSTEPRSRRMPVLVREYITRCLLAAYHEHTLEMYRANAHIGRRKTALKSLPHLG